MLHKISATGGRQGRYRNHKPHGSEVAIVSSSFAPSSLLPFCEWSLFLIWFAFTELRFLNCLHLSCSA